MTQSPISNSIGLEELVRSLELGWRLDLSGPVEQRIHYLQRRLDDGDEAARARFSDGSVRITLENVSALAHQSPGRARAFVEQLFDDGSPEMLVMVWRILTGADLGTVHLDLEQGNRFHLVIILRPDRTGSEEKYESDDVSDLRLVSHFGISKLNGQLPLLLGFYSTWRPSN
jgi:hypothetical protein